MEQIKKHNGYIVPFDIPSESLKKGDILRHKNGLDDDMFENIVILNSSYCLPPEWVETWEKYYQEELPVCINALAVFKEQVIELIEQQIEYRKENITEYLDEKNYLAVGYDELRIKELQFILQGIKEL